MNTAKKAAIAATLTGAVMGGALVGAGPAIASTNNSPEDPSTKGTCGQRFDPSVGGGAAGWTISCAGGKVRVQGWVKDTDEDGKAAEVFGSWGDGASFDTVQAGGEGTIKKFDRTHRGSTVKLQLRVV